MDKSKEIARLRIIKNIEKLIKEDLIFSLLKSDSSAVEHNFDNNNNNDKIRGKTRDINTIFSRLGNIVTKTDRKKI